MSDSARNISAPPKAGGDANLSRDYVYQPVPDGLHYETTGETGSSPNLGQRELAKDWSFYRECRGFANILLRWINILMIFVPLGITSHYRKWGSLATFGLNFCAIVPLAGVLGAATESLAVHTGQMVGGLLNATFGNAVEMIVTVQAIRAGLISVVKGSLVGSILSNLLLVLGMAFVAGGIAQTQSKFNATGAAANTACLVLGAIAIALPTIFEWVPETTHEDCLAISRISSCVVGAIYVCFLVFQLYTHAHLFKADEGEEEEEAELSACSSLILLLAATSVVAYCSEFLVDSIEGVTEEYGMPKSFIGVILLPIVGNAAEHATSVSVAAKGKMDLALGVAVGSSTQIILLVVPFSVITAWVYDIPMTLDFRAFDAAVLLLSVFLASIVLGDGSSNWLEGVMLCATYILIAIICWYLPEMHD